MPTDSQADLYREVRCKPLGHTDTIGLGAAAAALVALHKWAFLFGPGIMPAVNALCFATVLRRTGLVPRIIPTIGLIGAPLLVASSIATVFGAWGQTGGVALLFALPIATWELSVGVYMTVKGFRSDPVIQLPADADPVAKTPAFAR